METINYKVKVKWTKDKATRCWIIYSKKFEISAYGKTKKEARIMFDHQITQILLFTKTKPIKK